MNKSDLFTVIFAATSLILLTLSSYLRRLYWDKKIGTKPEDRTFYNNWILATRRYPENLLIVKTAENKINLKKTILIRIIDFSEVLLGGLIILVICFTLTYFIVYKLL